MGKYKLSTRNRLRRFLVAKQKDRCFYCGVRMYPAGTDNPRSATLDEKIPRSKGGKRNKINCVAACLKCNNSKSSMTITEFMLKGLTP